MILLSEEDGNRSHITTTMPMDVDTNITTLEEDRGPELEPFTKDGCSCAAVEEGCSCSLLMKTRKYDIPGKHMTIPSNVQTIFDEMPFIVNLLNEGLKL